MRHVHPRAITWLVLLIFVQHPARAQAVPPAPVEPLITVQKGHLPIILTAPHGGRIMIPDTPLRKGDRVLRFVKVRDENTAELTLKLADTIEKRLGGRPYIVIARFERKFADANRVPDEAYEHDNAKRQYDAFHAAVKEATVDVKRRWGRGLLLDVHGQAVQPNAIYRGTRDGKSTSELLKRSGNEALIGPDSIIGRLAAAGHVTLPPKPANGIGREERFNGGYITDTYGSHRGTSIDAIQLELGGVLRQKNRLDKTAGEIADAVAAFAKAYLPKDQTGG